MVFFPWWLPKLQHHPFIHPMCALCHLLLHSGNVMIHLSVVLDRWRIVECSVCLHRVENDVLSIALWAVEC